ncbi:cadmium resistance transporter [Rhizobium sp. NPDC090279]|uniref:cadmium resistance transporter n=1 Tax=Rhizobium sp. NPDC090279 TaxID=3364499 RepID=UPI00383BEF12
MFSSIWLAIALFASTNIDDIFVLLSLFADPKFRPGEIVVGQYVGIAALVAVSVAASLVSLILAPEYVGLLGLLPILIGLKRLYDLRKGNDRDEEEGGTVKTGFGNIAAVVAVTLANGGDNIGIYTPVFATSTNLEIFVYIVVFLAMVAVWLLLAHRMVNHPAIGAPIRRYGHVVGLCCKNSKDAGRSTKDFE